MSICSMTNANYLSGNLHGCDKSVWISGAPAHGFESIIINYTVCWNANIHRYRYLLVNLELIRKSFLVEKFASIVVFFIISSNKACLMNIKISKNIRDLLYMRTVQETIHRKETRAELHKKIQVCNIIFRMGNSQILFHVSSLLCNPGQIVF